MPLPPRSFHPLADVAIRWGVTPPVIVDWAIEGKIALSAVLPLVETKQDRPVEGLVEICSQDIYRLFDTGAKKTSSVRIQRFRRRARARWEKIVSPAEGIELTASGVVITRAEVERFERACGLVGHHLQPATTPIGRAYDEDFGRAGAPSRYDWDAFAGAVARRVHDEGMPASQNELIRDMLDWFGTTFGAVPDERTVRRRVQALWPVLTRRA